MSHDPARRLLTALDLHDLGVAMMRQRLRRENPDASEEELRSRLQGWLHTRPGAEPGDGVGHAVIRARGFGRGKDLDAERARFLARADR